MQASSRLPSSKAMLGQATQICFRIGAIPCISLEFLSGAAIDDIILTLVPSFD